MQDAAYFSAAVPEPRTILGLRLRPFSAGHIILLNRVQSAFVTGGDVGFADLALSVLICSMGFRDGVAMLDDPDTPKAMRRWVAHLTGIGWLSALRLKKLETIDLAAKAAEFSNYMDAGGKSPGYIIEDNNRWGVACPIVQVVKCCLLSKLTMTEDEFLDRPWALSLWDYVTMKVMEGAADFCDGDAIEKTMKESAALFERLERMAGRG